MKELQVVIPPKCNFCNTEPALYDAPTFMGSWAYACAKCAETKMDTLSNVGTKFVVKPITKAQNPEKVKMGLEDNSEGYLESVMSEGMRDIHCPSCDGSRHLEPDALGEFECEFCKQRVKIPEFIF